MTDPSTEPRLPDASQRRADAEYARELLARLREAGLSERAVARAIDVTDRVFRLYKDKGGMPYTVQFALETLLSAKRELPPSAVQETAARYGAERAAAPTIWHRVSDRRLSDGDAGKMVVGRDRFGCNIVGTLEKDGFGLVIRDRQSSFDVHNIPIDRVDIYTLLDPPPDDVQKEE